jgi:hypothetical protein
MIKLEFHVIVTLQMCNQFFYLQMNLKEKFEATTACNVIKINALITNRPYEIRFVERADTRLGTSIIMTLPMSPNSTAKVFLPKRYSGLFSDDINAIQTNCVRLQLIYLGTCPISKSFDLAIEPINPAA